MATEKKIRTVFTGVDRFSNTMNQFDSKMKRLRGQMYQFSRAITRVNRTMNRSFGVAVAGISAAGAAVFTVVKKTAEQGDILAKTARRMGVSVDTLQKMRFAAERSGVEMTSFDKGLERLSKTIVDAGQGLTTATRAFDILGITYKDQYGRLRSAEDVMLDLADAFSRVKDQTALTGLAMQLFGRAGGPLVNFLNEGRTGLKALFDEFEKFGGGFSEEETSNAEAFADAMTNLGVAMKMVQIKLAGSLMPVLTRFMNTLGLQVGDKGEGIREWADQMASQLSDFIQNRLPALWADFKTKMASLWSVLQGIGAAFKPLIDAVTWLARAVGPVNLVMGVFYGMLGINVLGAVVKVIGVVKALGSILAVVTTSSISPIILGVAALAAGLYLLYRWIKKNRVAIGAFFGGIYEGVKNAITPVIEHIKRFVDVLKVMGDLLFGRKIRALFGALGIKVEQENSPAKAFRAAAGDTLRREETFLQTESRQRVAVDVNFSGVPRGTRTSVNGPPGVVTVQEERDLGEFGAGAFSH